MTAPKDNGELEFRNPFANSTNGTLPLGRFSVSQSDQNYQGDELQHVTARLNSLTSSVSQLLALQRNIRAARESGLKYVIAP